MDATAQGRDAVPVDGGSRVRPARSPTNVLLRRAGFLAFPGNDFRTGRVVARSGRRLAGLGGLGKQVRAVLHVDDLVDLPDIQLAGLEKARGNVYTVGGGREKSLSLLETTRLCQAMPARRERFAAIRLTGRLIWP